MDGIQSYLNLGRILRLGARKFGDQTFLEFEDRTFTYADFDRQVNALADAFSTSGLVNGDRVLLMSENSPGYVRALFALAKLGVVAMPANAMLTSADIAALVRLTNPAQAVAGSSYQDKLRKALVSADSSAGVGVLGDDDTYVGHDGVRLDPVAAAAGREVPEPTPYRPIRDSDPGMILFTSGSTGTPKGIVKSYASLAWSAINHQISEPRRAGDRESFCLALAGVAFVNFLLLDALAGATCVLERKFSGVGLARTLATKGITHIFIAPTMISAIARDVTSPTFPDVRVVESSFEFPIEVRRLAVSMFPNATILWSFGSTEATMARTPPHYLLDDVTCVGYAGGLDEYRIDPDAVSEADPHGSVGEVQSFGPTVMLGYLSDPDEAATDRLGVRDDGWFATGDLGRIDRDGALHFAGRAKDMIKTGGANVFANEVENVLFEHPQVHNVAVLGLPDSYWGETVAAVIEVEDPTTTDVEAIREFAEARLAAFRRPKNYFLVRDLPKNPTGKIAKGVLRELISDGQLSPSRVEVVVAPDEDVSHGR